MVAGTDACLRVAAEHTLGWLFHHVCLLIHPAAPCLIGLSQSAFMPACKYHKQKQIVS